MGTHTMVSVVAAKTLGIPQSQVSVGKPDTGNELPNDALGVRLHSLPFTPEKILEALAALPPDLGKAKPEA